MLNILIWKKNNDDDNDNDNNDKEMYHIQIRFTLLLKWNEKKKQIKDSLTDLCVSFNKSIN